MHQTYVICSYRKAYCARKTKIFSLIFFFKAFYSQIILRKKSLKNFCESLYRIMVSGSKLKCIFLQNKWSRSLYENGIYDRIYFYICNTRGSQVNCLRLGQVHI